MTWLLVALGAAVGAPCRYLVDRFVQSRHERALPWGTFTVNVVGTFVLGALLAWPDVSADVVALIGTGWCGAFTTYSAFSFEVLALSRTHRRRAVGYLVVMTVSGLASASVAYAVVRALVAT